MLREACRDYVADGSLQMVRYVLLQQGDSRSRRKHHVPVVGPNLASKQPHQGCLARPVATQKANPLARFDLARNIVQQHGATETNRNTTKFSKCHKRNRRK
jgi:hypothetical protein